MEQSKIVKIFESIRDIPYSIPLAYEEKDNCCTGKNKRLLNFLEGEGYKARWRVCSFRWSDIKLPDDVLSKPHDDESTHAYLEVNIGGKWVPVDATWDNSLAKIFSINEWDSISATEVAVPCIELFTPEQSSEIIESETKEVVEEDLSKNGEFYKALNDWLESVRQAN